MGLLRERIDYSMCQARARQGHTEMPSVAGTAVTNVSQIAWSEVRKEGKAGVGFYGARDALLRNWVTFLRRLFCVSHKRP